MFEADEVALGGSARNPACIVAERGEYSLATFLGRMERRANVARPRKLLAHALEAIAYLHGRNMVRAGVAAQGGSACRAAL